jgi:hypothetical protein
MERGPILRSSIKATLPILMAAVGIGFAVVGPVSPWSPRAAAGEASLAAAADRADDSAGKSDSAPDAAATGQKDTADSHEISLLVRQLGDPAYTVRQRATKRLVELGIITQPLLTRALEDEDAEVRSRAGQVLAQVVEADFRLRLEAFANDPEGRQQHTLPCWGRFSQVFGQDKVSRMLFVEMQLAEPALLEALDTNPKLAGELFAMRIQSIRQSLQFPPRDGIGPPTISLGSICSLLLVSGTDGVTVSDQDAMQLSSLFRQPTFQRILQAHAGSAILKKMLGTWIVHNSSSDLAHQNFDLAFNLDLKEALDLGVKMLANEGRGQKPAIRQDALLAIGRYGNHTHIALVEPLLKDTDFCSPQQGNDPRQSQVRDVALAVLVHLSGQELKAYGLDHIPSHSPTLFQPGMIAFSDPLMRKTALHKWEIWSGRGGAAAAGADKSAAGTNAPNQPADGKPPASPAPKESETPATKSEQPTAPRPAELVP